jgi:hypothetical protein
VSVSLISCLKRGRGKGGQGRASRRRPAACLQRLAAGILILGMLFCLPMQPVPVLAESLDGCAWTEYSGNPTFSGINRAYYPSVMAVGGAYHMWYTDATAAGAYQVRHAASADGVTWSAPAALTGLAGGQPSHTVVVNVGSDASPSYRMWYGDGASWPSSDNCFRTAVSTDGVSWSGDSVIGQDPGGGLLRTDNVSDPAYQWRYGTYGPGAVLYNPSGYPTLNTADPMGNRYVMYYDGYSRYWLTGVQEVTMLAVSADGVYWSRYGNGPVLSGSGGSAIWDGQYAFAWSVIRDGTDYHLWYGGGVGASHEGIGYACSADGLAWAKNADPIMHISDPDVPAWRNVRTYTPCVLQEGDLYKMWFSGRTGSSYRIGYAVGGVPRGTPTDGAGAVKRSYYYRGTDVYCSGRGFYPGSSVDVCIVPEDDWSDGMAIPADVSGDAVNTLSADALGRLGNTLVWPGELTIGQYDIVFDADRDGVFDAVGDCVDNPHDPGFWIYGDPRSAAAYPGIGLGIAAALAAGALACWLRKAVAR